MRVDLFNSRNPNGKRVPVTVTIEHIDITETNDGELIYLLSFHTGAKSKTGGQVNSIYSNNVTKENILKEMEAGLSLIGDQIDWGVLEEDTHSPIITSISPRDGDTVSIDVNVSIGLKDLFPSSFIDPDSIKFTVNGFDVTNELLIKNKETDTLLSWIPKKIKI
jgi:hypothetical protein